MRRWGCTWATMTRRNFMEPMPSCPGCSGGCCCCTMPTSLGEPISKRSMPKECVRCSLCPAQSRWSGCAICPMAVTWPGSSRRGGPSIRCSRRCCVPTRQRGCERRLYALFVVHYAIRALMYCSALQADLDPDRLSFTEAVFQICQTVTDQRGEQEPAVQQWRTERLLQRLRRNLLAERHLRINRREIKQVYHKYKPKKRDVPPPKPFEPRERFEDFVVIVVRPQGSKLLAEVTPLVPI